MQPGHLPQINWKSALFQLILFFLDTRLKVLNTFNLALYVFNKASTELHFSVTFS